MNRVRLMTPTKPQICFANVIGLLYNKNVLYPRPITLFYACLCLLTLLFCHFSLIYKCHVLSCIHCSLCGYRLRLTVTSALSLTACLNNDHCSSVRSLLRLSKTVIEFRLVQCTDGVIFITRLHGYNSMESAMLSYQFCLLIQIQ